MEKISLKQRDIVLIPFPFSDQVGKKVRPAVIISNDAFNKMSEDIIICAISSNIVSAPHNLIVSQADIEEGVLYEQSIIKVHAITKIEKSLVIKKICRLHTAAFIRLREIIIGLITPS